MALERGEGFGADMVFNAFGIHLRDTFRDPKAAQECNHSFVPTFARGGERATLVGQKNCAIRLGGHQAGLLQPSDGPIHSNVRDAEAFSEVNNPRFPDFAEQIRNGLDVILGDFVGVFAARLREILGLSLAARAPVSRCL